MEKFFNKIASATSRTAGKPIAFLLAAGVVIAWAVTGPMFNYSETWQLVINTFTTICTFLMVFLIQNSQNRDGLAIQAKLDELILATKDARDELTHLEDEDEKTITEVRR
jgi:low affinity Fe/Cu permease